MRNSSMSVLAVALLALAAGSAMADPLSSAFTYQGRLEQSGQPYQGTIGSLRFLLYESATGSNSLGAFLASGVPVQDGVFTTEVDFGAGVFDGQERWLEIMVEGQTLSPRQRLSATPYSLQTRGITVDDALNVGIGTGTPLGRLHVEGPSGDDAVIVPPGAISADELLDEPGQARTETQQLLYLSEYGTSMVTTSVYCPTNGFVLAMAEAEFVTGMEPGEISEVWFDIRPFGSTTTPARRFTVSTSIGHRVRQSCVRVFPVEAGTQMFEFVGQSWNSSASPGRAWNPELTLVFLPTQY